MLSDIDLEKALWYNDRYRKGKAAMSVERRKKSILCLIILDAALLIFSLAFYFAFRDTVYGESICAVQKLLRIYCPACGGTRAFFALLSFDIAKAFIYYPPIFVGILLVLWCNFIFIMRAARGDGSFLDGHRYYEFIALAAAIIVNFIVRNALLFFGIDPLGNIISESALIIPDLFRII